MKSVYVVVWGNGNADVFADVADAAGCYEVVNKHDDTEMGMYQHACTGGDWISVERALGEFPASADTVWSDKAKSVSA